MRYIISIVTTIILFISFASYSGADEATKTALFERLANAKNQMEGRKIEHEIWEYWTAQAPTKEVHAKLVRGMEKRRESDLLWSEDLLDEVINASPEYAEGWNQRAFTRFLKGDMVNSLSDLEKALELEPMHFAAMSGMYHILIQMGRKKAAHNILLQAIEIHPWIKERSALPKNLLPPLPSEVEKL